MTKLNHVPHRTLHTLVEDVEEFKIYYELFRKGWLPRTYEERFPQILERLNYLEAIELVYHRVLNNEVQLDSFIRYLGNTYRNNLTDEEALFYYEKILEVFGREFIYNKLDKLFSYTSRSLLISPFNTNELDPRVWQRQYWANRPSQKPTWNKKMKPYANSRDWYISPREKHKDLYKKRYRQKLKTELNKELNEYFTNTY